MIIYRKKYIMQSNSLTILNVYVMFAFLTLIKILEIQVCCIKYYNLHSYIIIGYGRSLDLETSLDETIKCNLITVTEKLEYLEHPCHKQCAICSYCRQDITEGQKVVMFCIQCASMGSKWPTTFFIPYLISMDQF